MVAEHPIDEDYHTAGVDEKGTLGQSKSYHSYYDEYLTPAGNEEYLATKRSSDNSMKEKTDGSGTRAPKSCQTVLKYYSQFLTAYEQKEVLDYEHIYFLGLHAKKVQAVPEQPQYNYRYDDERGDYHIVLQDHLAYRYEVLEVLGQGSFGQVVRCLDHKTGETVAIKLIRNKKRFHAQALTEVRILKKLVQWVRIRPLRFSFDNKLINP